MKTIERAITKIRREVTTESFAELLAALRTSTDESVFRLFALQFLGLSDGELAACLHGVAQNPAFILLHLPHTELGQNLQNLGQDLGKELGQKTADALTNLLRTHASLTEVYLTEALSSQQLPAALKALSENRHTSIETLWLPQNNIGDEAVQALADLLQTNTSLTTVFLDDKQLSDQQLASIINALAKNARSAITSFTGPEHPEPGFSFFGNQMGPETIKAFANLLQTNKSLEMIDCYDWELLDEQLAFIITALSNNRNTLVKWLTFGKIFGKKSVKAFADLLRTNRSLTHFDLSAELLDDHFASIITALSENPNTSIIHFDGHISGEKSFKAFVHLLRTNRSLNFWKASGLSDQQLASAIRALSENPYTSITSFRFDNLGSDFDSIPSFRFGKLGEEALQAFESLLKTSKSLFDIDLSDVELSDQRLATLLRGLSQNLHTSVTKLKLTGKNMGDDSVKALRDLLRTNQTLTTVDLGGIDLEKKLSDQQFASVITAISDNPNTAIIKFYFFPRMLKQLGEHTFKALEHLLQTNQSLLTINLGVMGLSCHQLATLLLGLSRNRETNITELNLEKAKTDDESVKALVDLLSINKSFTTVNLSHLKLSGQQLALVIKAVIDNPNIPITKLFLWENGDKESDEALRTLLKTKSLTTFDVYNMGLSDQRLSTILLGLSENPHPSVTSLVLPAGNEVGPQSTALLIEILRTNTTITSIKLPEYNAEIWRPLLRNIKIQNRVTENTALVAGSISCIRANQGQQAFLQNAIIQLMPCITTLAGLTNPGRVNMRAIFDSREEPKLENLLLTQFNQQNEVREKAQEENTPIRPSNNK